MRAALLTLSVLVACGRPTPETTTTAPVEAAPPRAANVVWFEGACDASAAVVVDGRVVVADDETNVLRAYATSGGAPLAVSADLSVLLGATPKGDGFREFDFEGAAAVGDRFALIGSHGANKKGKARPGRRRVVVAKLAIVGAIVSVEVDQRFDGLVETLAASSHPTLTEFGLAEAATRAPKTDNGLNIEGLAAGPGGGLVVGFRGPVVAGRALVVGLDPTFAPTSASALDLGGLGVRSMERVGDAWLIVAGPHTSGGPNGMFRWTAGAPEPLPLDLPSEFNPEALVAVDAELLLLSDDGTRAVDGRDCKDAPPERRAFRGLRLPAP